MTPTYIGRSLGVLRRRCRLRQVDLGAKVGVSQGAVSRAECGELNAVSLRTLQRMFEEVGGELVLNVRYRGGELDRLMDRAHAGLVEQTARRLVRLGWEVHLEVSYSVYGERGSIDILAWHPAERIALVVEVKSELTSVEETLRRHDVKVRLAPNLVFDRLGVRPSATARLLVLPATAAARRRIERHAGTFGATYPARGRDVVAWLRLPAGPLAGILFEPPPGTTRTVLRRRVRTGRGAAA